MSSTETHDHATWVREMLLGAVADYPPVVEVVSVLLDASEAMQASSDVRWRVVGEYVEEQADLIATPNPLMPHAQMSVDWLERNHRALLEMARTYLTESQHRPGR